MAVGKRRCGELADTDWSLQVEDHGTHVTLSVDRIQVVLLWECLQQLKNLNRILGCQNFTNLPKDLRSIKREVATIRKRLEVK